MRRTLAFLAALAALVLAPAALAVDVHVRVEGQTVTIFGERQPLIASGATPLDVLETASLIGEFYYHVARSSFGPYVDQIGRNPASGSAGWVFKVNGAMPPVGADKVELKNRDTVLWYWADFDASGAGPPTLQLVRVKAPRGRSCYRVAAQNDQGQLVSTAGAVLRAGSHTYLVRNGRACIKGKHAAVRATMKNAVRSNVLP